LFFTLYTSSILDTIKDRVSGRRRPIPGLRDPWRSNSLFFSGPASPPLRLSQSRNETLRRPALASPIPKRIGPMMFFDVSRRPFPYIMSVSALFPPAAFRSPISFFAVLVF